MDDIQRSLEQFGWAKIEKVFSDAEVAEIADLANELAIQQTLDGTDPALVDASDAGEITPRKLAEPFFQSEKFRQFIFSRKIANLVNPILGPGAELLFDHVFMKPPVYGALKHWHQDGFYFDVAPIEKGISVWIALTDADESNGCLRYIPGSHKQGLLPHTQPDDNPALAQANSENLNTDNAVAVPAKRGDVILHHYHALHSSGPNHSPNSRIAYATHWLAKLEGGAGASWYKRYPLREEYNRLIEEEQLAL